MKTRSGLRESPVMTLGDKKEGRSAYNKQSENEKNVLARERKTELWRQVHRPSSRYDLQLETTCWKVQIGGKMSMQLTEKWTICRDFSWLPECCSDI